MKNLVIKIPLLIILLWCNAGNAQTIVTTAVTAASCTNNLIVPVTVTNCNDIGAISLVLNYNNSNLTFAGYQQVHSQLLSGLLSVNATTTSILFSWAGNTAANIGNDTLVKFIFTSVAGTSALSWDVTTPGSCEYSNTGGTILPSSYYGGNVTRYQLPVINTQPSNQSVLNGQIGSFTINGSATGIVYLWQGSSDNGVTWSDLSNAPPYSGTNTATMTINPTSLSMNGNLYRCRVSGTCSPEQYSDSALLSIKNPVITTLPTFSVCPVGIRIPVTVSNFDDIGAFSLTFSYDTAKMTYSGYQNFHPALASGTMSVNEMLGRIYLTWASAAPSSIGADTLIEFLFTNSSGNSVLTWDITTPGNSEYTDSGGAVLPAVFNNGTITTYAVPAVMSHPASTTIAKGQNTNFSITATGASLSYRWQISIDGGYTWNDLSNVAPYSGTSTATLTVTNAQLNLNGNLYRCRVSGTCNPAVYSNAGKLTVLPNITTICQTFTTCPGNATVVISVNEFIDVASFSLCLGYNQSVMTYTGYQNVHSHISSAGIFSINEINGKIFISWSNTADTTIANGSTLIELLFVSSPGTSNMTWDVVTPGNCEYSNAEGQIVYSTWTNGTLTFQQPPAITSHPVNKTTYGAGSTTFNVTATGTGITYRWQESTDNGLSWHDLSNGAPYSGVTGATLTISPATEVMNGFFYRCRVSGTCPPFAVSNSALLTVTTAAIYASIQNMNYSCNGEIIVPVNVQNCNNVGSMSLALNYDSTKLSFAGYQGLHPSLPAGMLIVNGTGTTVFFSWASTTPANLGNSTLVKLLFTGNAGISTPLTFDAATPGNCEFSDPLGTIITSFYTNATITVSNTYPTYSVYDTAEICNGETYLFNSQILTTAGDYTHVLENIHGCDSIIYLNLIVHPAYEFVTNAEVCDSASYSWRGNIYTVTGTYSDSLLTIHGCDSLYILNLVVRSTCGHLISGKTRYAGRAITGNPAPNPPSYDPVKYNIDNVIIILKTYPAGAEVARDTSNALGIFEFTDVADGNYKLSYDKYTPDTMQMGNAVDAIDVTILKYYIGIDTLVDPSRNFSAKYKKAANVDNNTAINAIDISRIKAKIGSPFLPAKNFPKGNWVALDTMVAVSGADIYLTLKTICYGDYNASSVRYRDSATNWSQVKSVQENIIAVAEEYITTCDASYFEVPLRISTGMNDFSTLGLELNYPGNQYRLVSAAMSKNRDKNSTVKINASLEEILADDNDLLVTDEDGVIRVVYATTNHFDVSANEELIRLGFQSLKEPVAGELKLDLSGTGIIADQYGTESNDAYLVMPKILVQGNQTDGKFDFTAYPNPFLWETTLNYIVPENGTVNLSLFNAIGGLVKELVNEPQAAGKYSLTYTPHKLPCGMYTFKLEFVGVNISKCMVLNLVH
ncbi:MAG TPA: hypothetical protein PKW80_10510 [Bacteroidales bacterium]|nr:hypothetical protein [Bacteroidales bacterium]